MNKQRFLQELQASPTKRIDYDAYWAAYRRTNDRITTNAMRGHLHQLLNDLNAEGHLTFPKAERLWTRGEHPSLPKYLTLVRDTPNPERTWRDHPWPAQLDWVPGLTSLTSTEEAFLREVDKHLLSGGFHEPAPLKYRSLQLAGDEKALPALLKGKLFYPGRLTLKLLNVESGPLPLTRERIQDGGRYLIIENEEAFRTILSTLSATPNPPYDWVAHGRGNALVQSIGWLKHVNAEVTSLHFLGDLDAAGLRTAIGARDKTRELGLPVLEPAVPLHQAMLDGASTLGQPHGLLNTKLQQQQEGIQHADTLVTFLAPQHQEVVKHVLKLGNRIPEEASAPHIREALSTGNAHIASAVQGATNPSE